MIRVLPFPTALFLAAALAAPALADDTPVVTAAGGAGAPVASGAMSTAEQIDNYLKTSPVLKLPPEGAVGVTSSEEPRKVHGEVELAVGTGGFRSAYARADLPVGKTGVVSVAVQQTQFNGRGGGQRSHQNLALGFAVGDAATEAGEPRCRRGPDGEPIAERTFHPAKRGRPLAGLQGCRAAPQPPRD
jgi:hypothetical protein